MMAPQLSVTTNAPTTARWNRYPTNATIPQPPSSFMAPGVAAAAAATTTGNNNNKTTELATFYIHSIFHRSGQLFHIDQPADIPTTPPVAIKRPQYPERRQLSMRMLTPCILYVQYPCEQKCRNLGICIHYQFVVGCRKCPDGLRCEICVASGVEEVSASITFLPTLGSRKAHSRPMLSLLPPFSFRKTAPFAWWVVIHKSKSIYQVYVIFPVRNPLTPTAPLSHITSYIIYASCITTNNGVF